MIEVWAARRNSGIAAVLVAQLKASGRTACRVMNTRYFDPKQIEKGIVQVYHDGSDPLIPWSYAKLGVPCEPIPGTMPNHPAVQSEDWHIRTTGERFQLYGPNGPVGTPQDTEAAAWAQTEGQAAPLVGTVDRAPAEPPSEAPKRRGRKPKAQA